MPTPITIVFLTCNRTTYIRQALDGLLKQNYAHWSLVASDCSDQPAARAELHQILTDFRQKVPLNEVNIIQQDGRIPQSEHHRRALAHVKTPFAAYLDDDDIYLPDHLERACAWLEESPRHGLAISNGKVIDATGTKHGWTNSRENPLPASDDQQGWLGYFMSSFYGSTSGFIFRVEALANHPFVHTPMVDIHVALTIALNGYEIIGFPEASYLYRVHGESFYASNQIPGSALFDKGPFIVRDRHNLRLWLLPYQGVRLTRKLPLYPIYVLKSAWSVLKDVCLGITRNKAKDTG